MEKDRVKHFYMENLLVSGFSKSKHLKTDFRDTYDTVLNDSEYPGGLLKFIQSSIILLITLILFMELGT